MRKKRTLKPSPDSRAARVTSAHRKVKRQAAQPAQEPAPASEGAGSDSDLVTTWEKQFQAWALELAHNEHVSFQRTGNGLHMWRAYSALRCYIGTPIPEYVLSYFDDVARDLESADGLRAVKRALRLRLPTKKGARASKAAEVATRNRRLYLRALSWLELRDQAPRWKSDKAFWGEVGEHYGLQWSSAKSIFHRMKNKAR